MSKDKLAIVMPVYNEEACIAGVLRKWVEALDALDLDYRIHVYNDGSRDHTLEVLNRAAAELGGTVVVHDKPNGGHGHTILTGYRQNCEQNDWIFQIDSDDEMGPESFHELWAVRNNYDLLVGYRDGRIQNFIRKTVSLASRLSVRLLFGKSIWDVNTPYRLMRTAAFRDVYRMIPDNTFAPNVIISGIAASRKLRCFEMPVPQQERKTGEVSIRKWKLLKAALKSFGQTSTFAAGYRAKGVCQSCGTIAESKFFLAGFMLLIALLCTIHCFSFLFWERSPVISADGAVFYTVADLWFNGKIPYAEAFDHKGPVVYLINLAAVFLGGPRYILVMELAACLLTAIFLYQTCRLFTTRMISLLALLLFPLFWAWSMNWNICQGGNFTEEYALPAIAYGCYLLAKLTQNRQIRYAELLLGGAAAGYAFLLKPNFIAIFLVLLLAVAVQEFTAGTWKRFAVKTVIYILGGLAALAPFAIYFMAQGAWRDFLDAFLQFNLKYSGDLTLCQRIVTAALRILKQAIFFIPLLICVSLIGWRRNHSQAGSLAALAFYLLVGLGCTGMAIFSNSFFSQYYVICAIPLMIIPYAMLLEANRINRRLTGLALAVVIFLNVSNLAMGLQGICNEYPAIAADYQPDPQIAEALKKHNGELLVLGNLCHLYQVYGVQPVNKYFYQTPVINYDPKIFARVRQELLDGKAAVVIQTRMAGPQKMRHEIDKILNEHYTRHSGRGFDFYIYSRNQPQ